MDTKLKGSKKISLLTAGILVFLASVIFFVMEPMFEKAAKEREIDILQSELFQKNIYLADFILYKDLQEMLTGQELSYHELFLDIKEKKEPEDYKGQMPHSDLRGESFKELAEQTIDYYMSNREKELLNGLTQSVDYCITDKETGKQIKNTKNELMKLGTKEADKTLSATYSSYIKMDFDEAGFLESVSVLGNQSDGLLKRVQSTMKSGYLKQETDRLLSERVNEENDRFYYYGGDSPYTAETVLENGPKGASICYAITEKQMDALTKSFNEISDYWLYNRYVAYKETGCAEVCRIIMAVLFLFALLLPLWKSYSLQEWKGVKLHLEFALFAGAFCLSEIPEICIMVSYMRSGYLDRIFKNYIPMMPKTFYPLLNNGVNLLILFFLFGAWYYIATSFGEVFSLGIKEFVKERSLLFLLLRGGKNIVKEKGRKLQEEILHVDLGKKANKLILKLVVINFFLLAAVCMLWMFGWLALLLYSMVIYVLLKKYVQEIQVQYRRVLAATRSISGGNLNTALNEDFGVFEVYKAELAQIQNGFKKAVEEEVKSQRMQTELITNVSHDLKTPLTAITTYIELLDQENLPPEQRKEYLGILKKKSERLKFLIEDLFEVSKANSGNVALDPVDVDICSLARQVYLEYEDKAKEADLSFRFSFPEEKVILQLDSQKTYRIFENLYTNIIKYAMKGSRVYINGIQTEESILFEMKNMSSYELNIDAEELTERFVRGDSARNTEGSGLGLAIAKSLTEIQGGKLQIEIDGDLFKVNLQWPLKTTLFT